MAIALLNPGFEDGTFTGWDITVSNPGDLIANAVVSNPPPYAGTYNAFWDLGGAGPCDIEGINEAEGELAPGTEVTAGVWFKFSSTGTSNGRVVLYWYDAADILLSESPGTVFAKPGNASERWYQSTVTEAAPANTAYVRAGFKATIASGADIRFDNLSWDYQDLPTVTLLYPVTGSTYEGGAEVPFRVNITNLGDAVIDFVEYVATNVSTTAETIIGPVNEDPWGINYSTLPEGDYSVVARVHYESGFIQDSSPNTFTVGPVPAPDTREFKASNSYTNLVAKNFVGLASAIPPTAQVVGMETVVDYYIQALIRSKDLEVSDPTVARYSAAFEMVPSVTFETVLLQDDGSTYTVVGSNATEEQDVLSSDFSVTEDGTSEDKRWTVLAGDPQQIVIGSSSSLFGLDFMTASEFVTKALGLRFYPNLSPKPDYADSGDACFRVNLDKLRIQIYFDAGSVEYYFVSPDGTQVIKGRLAAAYVDAGAFDNGDASGIMQLASDLEVIDGTSRTILDTWTIHSAYPPTEANQIGVVNEDMSYNGLPTYWEVEDNRSRYQFISANFYGDLTYDSIYGVNGVGRAFSYNGDYFYKIHTQPDIEKDKPRHVEFYHTHLALGYNEGRVDISVVGEPYNFNGEEGSSSWTIGDSVTGLQTLSGTMLGIFGRKSIHAIAGTTVDNFSTQVLSPKIGAVEYTITDMGFPVYANAYGIYTLAQTNQYGDYLGTPMSQDVSPWLRPRLIRKSTSPREVVVAWPVRSKNQYRLAFADGYVLTMTMNNGLQEAPTFSQQKYFTEYTGEEVITLYEYPAIVPSAVSSELDDGGEERIHIANKQQVIVESIPVDITFTCGWDQVATIDSYPSWFNPEQPFTISGTDWSALYTWNGVSYDVSDLTGDTFPVCCDPFDATITQGSNTTTMRGGFNCA